jgi:hypothetical protein
MWVSDDGVVYVIHILRGVRTSVLYRGRLAVCGRVCLLLWSEYKCVICVYAMVIFVDLLLLSHAYDVYR